MTGHLSLSSGELAEVQEILARHLPKDVKVFAFGSRAGGSPKAWSDLDLALSGPELIPIALLARLAEDFSESSLPWKVDLVDRASVSDAFGEIIDRSGMPIQFDP